MKLLKPKLFAYFESLVYVDVYRFWNKTFAHLLKI